MLSSIPGKILLRRLFGSTMSFFEDDIIYTSSSPI
jgi:hypothetical protein